MGSQVVEHLEDLVKGLFWSHAVVQPVRNRPWDALWRAFSRGRRSSSSSSSSSGGSSSRGGSSSSRRSGCGGSGGGRESLSAAEGEVKGLYAAPGLHVGYGVDGEAALGEGPLVVAVSGALVVLAAVVDPDRVWDVDGALFVSPKDVGDDLAVVARACRAGLVELALSVH